MEKRDSVTGESSVVEATPGSSPTEAHRPVGPSVRRYIVTEYNDAYNPGALPRIPLRVPQRSARRSAGPSPHQSVLTLPSVASSTASGGHVTPPYKEEDSEAFKPDNENDNSLPTCEDGAHRQRSRRFLMIVGIVTILVIVGLAIGLTLGLRNKVSTQGSEEDGSSSGGSVFPEGSFSFDTTLQKTSTGCTSRNTTWVCEPKQGAAAVFYWSIIAVDNDTYTISSEENVFAPSFRNVSMKLVDSSLPTERLTFSFPVNRTIVPSDVGATTERAAKCTFSETTFEAALYTRKRGHSLIQQPKEHTKYSSWPGDIAVAQTMDSTIGQPACVDSANHPIADVQAAQGTCECRYGSSNKD